MSGSKSRRKGHKYEIDVKNEMIELGYKRCLTSRYESRSKDDAKIDLCYTDPFSIQCKHVERLGSLHNILDEMPDDDNINLVFHKRNRKGDIVAMKKEDFYKIVRLLKKHGELKI